MVDDEIAAAVVTHYNVNNDNMDNGGRILEAAQSIGWKFYVQALLSKPVTSE